jgi:hypothetical protein
MIPLTNSVDLVEYDLTLSSGEFVLVSELDRIRVPEVNLPEINLELRELLGQCVQMDRQSVEDMKLGYDKTFRSKFRTPIYSLMNVTKTQCRHGKDGKIVNCGSFDKGTCSTKNLDLKKKKALFPICFEYKPSVPENHDAYMASVMIGSAILWAWAGGRVVIDIID